MVKARKIVVARAIQGLPTLEDFREEEEELPPLSDGHILAEAVYIGVDPFQTAFKEMIKVGDILLATQVARIVESRSADFPVGRHLVGYWGCRDRTVVDVRPSAPYFMSPPRLVPDLGELPLSLILGVLGTPAITAYFGFLEICKPKAGQIVVVSGAAGAVGSVVGQIARIKGCKAIGIAGSDEKVKWLTDELGFDHAINYKTTDVTAALETVAPDGVDLYFDNVGGELSSTVINSMREGGRISACGSISSYFESEPPKATVLQRAVIIKQLTMKGFTYFRWQHRWDEATNQLLQWVKEGKLKYKETVTEGFSNVPAAHIRLLRGENYGKVVVKI